VIVDEGHRRYAHAMQSQGGDGRSTPKRKALHSIVSRSACIAVEDHFEWRRRR